MRIIGEAQQQWAPLRRKYNLFLFRRPPTPETDLGTRRLPVADLPLSTSQKLQVTQLSKNKDEGEYGQFAYVDEPFLSWDFSLLSADSRLIGSVNRNFAGFGREIFTDTGVYALRMDAAGLAAEPQHLISKTGQKSELAYNGSNAGMTLDQRAVMLATAVSVDFDYFSRKSGSGGFMPMWFPWWGGGAGETAGGVAGAEAAGGAVEGMGTSAAGGLARGAGGIGEGAAVGAGSMAGYEAMQRGTYGSDSSPTTGQSPSPGQAPSQQGADVEGEEVWGEHDAPWGEGKGGSGGERGSGDGGEGGEGGDWFDPSEWF